MNRIERLQNVPAKVIERVLPHVEDRAFLLRWEAWTCVHCLENDQRRARALQLARCEDVHTQLAAQKIYFPARCPLIITSRCTCGRSAAAG